MSSEYPIEKPKFVDAKDYLSNYEKNHGFVPESLRRHVQGAAGRVLGPDGEYNYRPEGPRDGDTVFIPALEATDTQKIPDTKEMPVAKDSSIDRLAFAETIKLDKIFSKKMLGLFLITLLTISSRESISNVFRSATIEEKPAVDSESENIPAGQVDSETETNIEYVQKQIAERVSNFQDYAIVHEDNSAELQAKFEKKFTDLQKIISDLDIPQSHAHSNLNDPNVLNALVYIVNTFNREQKLQVFNYLESLRIIPKSARETYELNTNTFAKVERYVADYINEKSDARRARIEQRVFTLLLRAVVEREPIDEIIKNITLMNPSTNLSFTSTYQDVVKEIAENSSHTIDVDRLLEVKPIFSNGLREDYDHFRTVHAGNIPHLDLITTNTLLAIAAHEHNPRFRNMDNEEKTNQVVAGLYDINHYRVVRFQNGILTIGPTQMQDWKIHFSHLPKEVQTTVKRLAMEQTGIEVNDIVSAIRASVLSNEVQAVMSMALLASNFDTLDKNLKRFHSASKSDKRKALVLSNFVGTGKSGRKIINTALRTGKWGEYVEEVYRYIALFQKTFTK